MQLIRKYKTRNVTFKKRKEVIIRKLHEFTTLCDVSACMIVYGPRNENGSTSEPETWPQNLDRVHSMIGAYRSKNNDYGSRKTFGLSDFFQERERKVKDEIEKLRKKNKESKYPTGVDGTKLSFLSEEKLREFGAGLSNKAENVRKRIEFLKRIKQSGLMVDSSLVNFGHDQSFYTAPSQMFKQQNHISIANFGTQCYNNNNNNPSAYDGLDQNSLMMLLMNGDQYQDECLGFEGPPIFNSSEAYYGSDIVGPTAYQMASRFYEGPLVPQPVPVPPPSMFSDGAPMPLQMASMEGYMDLGNQEDIINQLLMIMNQPTN